MPRYKIDNKERIQLYTSKEHKDLMKEVAEKEHTTITAILLRAFDLYYKNNYNN